MAFAALAAPTPALAGTYTWDLATDFTATAPGANPDHDPYGVTPWVYEEGSTPSLSASTTFSPLLYFGAEDVQGGLSAWSASSGGSSGPLVGINPTGSAIVTGSSTFPSGQIVLEPGTSNVVAVEWTSPFSDTEAVSIDGSVGSDSTCEWSTMWTLEVDGNLLLSGTVAQPFSPSTSVPPGGTISFVVANTGDATCAATGLSLNISANGSAPAPTVTSPAPASSGTVTSPAFAGTAGAAFGDGSQVTLRVYSGQAASGTPVQTVSVPRSGAGWSASLDSPLPLGTYTAQAEQDDISSPADVGLSAPVTFTVRVPSIALDSLGAKPLSTSSPTFTGTADATAGADPFAVVQVYAGTAVSGQPARTLTAALSATGQFSVAATPSLPDGTYTALAAQTDVSGTTGFSAPQTFSVDTHAPAVTVVSPGKGSRANTLKIVFTGAAGSEPFDSHTVTVTLYKGKKAQGKRYGTVRANVTGSTWSTKWPKMLGPAVYTVLASQGDAVGHIGTSVARTFTVVPLPPVIAKTATISKSGHVGLKVSCNEPAGDGCSGTVSVLTRAEFQPLAGGPVGRLTVMFAYVHIPGGQTSKITRTVLAAVADVLRGHANVAVTVTANLHPAKGKAIHATARDNLRRV